MIKETFTVKLTYEMSVDSDTGNIIETKLISREIDNSDIKPKTSKKKIEDSDTEPKLYIENNKYRLNNAAIKLMNINSGDKLSITYEQGKNEVFPIIALSEVLGERDGNKLTKSNTVILKGAKYEALSKYGTEFTILTHPNKENVFILNSGKIPEVLEGDENIYAEDDIFDLDIKDMVEDESDITEIDSNFFKLD